MSVEHRALPHGKAAWIFNGQLFDTKGACVAYMVEHIPLSWKQVAEAFPGGTKDNCKSAYRHFRQTRAVAIARAVR